MSAQEKKSPGKGFDSVIDVDDFSCSETESTSNQLEKKLSAERDSMDMAQDLKDDVEAEYAKEDALSLLGELHEYDNEDAPTSNMNGLTSRQASKDSDHSEQSRDSIIISNYSKKQTTQADIILLEDSDSKQDESIDKNRGNTKLKLTPAADNSKTPISHVVSSIRRCMYCRKEKFCGFRFRQNETDDCQYLCSQKCCDALLERSPEKYFLDPKQLVFEEFNASSRIPVQKHCLQCKKAKTGKYFLTQDNLTRIICSPDCWDSLNANEPKKFQLKKLRVRLRRLEVNGDENSTRAAAKSGDGATDTSKSCGECHNVVNANSATHLIWETLHFCDVHCLNKYQRTIGSSCFSCDGDVSDFALGRYCVRFGYELRQFCTSQCLQNSKRGIKSCTCCQVDISKKQDPLVASVGDSDQFKDFCSQTCLYRYESICFPKRTPRVASCRICGKAKPVRVEAIIDGQEVAFCSNPCYSAFTFVKKIDTEQCSACMAYFDYKNVELHTIYEDDKHKIFCSPICKNAYIHRERFITNCHFCKIIKKYNFDMIQKRFKGVMVLLCSIDCLNNLENTNKKGRADKNECAQCHTLCSPQLSVNMSDLSVRMFCSSQCVMRFQKQFEENTATMNRDESSASSSKSRSKIGPNSDGIPFPISHPKRIKIKSTVVEPEKPLSKRKRSPTPDTPTNADADDGSISDFSLTLQRQRKRTNVSLDRIQSPIESSEVKRRGRSTRKQAMTIPVSPTSTLSNNSYELPTRSTRRSGKKSAENLEEIETSYHSQIKQSASRLKKPLPTNTSDAGSVTKSTSRKKHTATVNSTDAMEDSSYDTNQTRVEHVIKVVRSSSSVRNIQINCNLLMANGSSSVTKETREFGTQTDEYHKIIMPVPVPVYVPVPMHMYSAPFPVPVPFPLPVPVPIFIPTTRNSANGIMKEIKKIQEKTPADPREAELLLIAAMVAEEKNESDSDSDNDVKAETSNYAPNIQTTPLDESQSYQNNILDNALKMSQQYEQDSNAIDSALGQADIQSTQSFIQQNEMLQMSTQNLEDQQVAFDDQNSPIGQKRVLVAGVLPLTRNNPWADQTITNTSINKKNAQPCLKHAFGVNAWKQWVISKNDEISKNAIRRRPFKTDVLEMTADELNATLCLFVKEVRKPSGTEYAPDTIYYLVLGIQQHLYINGRMDNIFYDPFYERFTKCLDEIAQTFSVLYNDAQYIVTRVEEEHLWECKQLGAHSPHVLLTTLMFFNTQYFHLATVQEHMQLSFTHIMKHWTRSPQNTKTTRNILLRFYPPQNSSNSNTNKKRVYEQHENEKNPLRCPVRFYEFYLSKCPESVKTRNDVFYLQPERSCVPESPVWYSTQAFSEESLERMLNRVKMVKEINSALLEG